MRRTITSLTLLFAVLLAAPIGFARSPVASAERPRSFAIGLIGDFPYDDLGVAQAENLIDEINSRRLSFVIHDGDIKAGSTPCTDDVYLANLDRFNRIEDPLIYTPGDNEWTDCHRTGGDPLERLDFLRGIFFPTDQSLGGRTITLNRQSDAYPENVRWTRGGVTFATLHIVGSNNNLGRTPEADAEYTARNAANLEWLHESFEAARKKDSPGIMIAIQANPGFELEPDDPERTGFNDFLAALEQETLAFGRPVVLVHGDSHYFRIDKPMYSSETGAHVVSFTRVETFGPPDVHWVRAVVRPGSSEVFSFDDEIVEENVTPAP